MRCTSSFISCHIKECSNVSAKNKNWFSVGNNLVILVVTKWAVHLATCHNLMFVDLRVIVKFMKKNPTRCNNVSKLYYSLFIWSSTCFVRHTAHHQELPDNVHRPHVQQPSMYEKSEDASAVLGSWWWAVCRPKHVELHINRE